MSMNRHDPNSPGRALRGSADGRGVHTSHLLDIVLWVLWLVIMWGFLLTLAWVSSPHDRPGLHELIISGYFLGFTSVFALIYVIVIKRG